MEHLAPSEQFITNRFFTAIVHVENKFKPAGNEKEIIQKENLSKRSNLNLMLKIIQNIYIDINTFGTLCILPKGYGSDDLSEFLKLPLFLHPIRAQQWLYWTSLQVSKLLKQAPRTGEIIFGNRNKVYAHHYIILLQRYNNNNSVHAWITTLFLPSFLNWIKRTFPNLNKNHGPVLIRV